MSNETEFFGTKIAVSKLNNGDVAAFTFKNTTENLDSTVIKPQKLLLGVQKTIIHNKF